MNMKKIFYTLSLVFLFHGGESMAMRLTMAKEASLMKRPNILNQLALKSSLGRCDLAYELRPDWEGYDCHDRNFPELVIQDYGREIQSLERKIRRGLDATCRSMFGKDHEASSVITSSRRNGEKIYSVLCSPR